jgi:hypothetical protein
MEEQMGSLECSTKASAVLAMCLLFLTLGATDLAADTLAPGPPTSGGTDVVDLYDKNGAIVATIKVAITADMTAGEKANAIVDAIVAQDYSASITLGGLVSIAKTGRVASWKFISGTGEMNKAGQASTLAIGPAPLSLGFEGSLSGIGFPGHQASYTVGVGFDLGHSSILALSNITYASLANKTLSGLLTLTFNNLDAALPPADRGLLSLNLATDTINFTPPLGATNVFVASLSLDMATSSSVDGSAVTPEPSTAWLALTGAALIFGATKFQQRRSKRRDALFTA